MFKHIPYERESMPITDSRKRQALTLFSKAFSSPLDTSSPARCS